jgi:2-polyprenyl-3-methyl-5-hydroxy-6-metoxy-1,4-benzoquinol methylase
MDKKLTDEVYWDTFWRNPFGASASHFSFHYWTLSRELARQCRPGARSIELGCGGSVWVPMLAARGVESWGIDYSEVGVRSARQTVARWNTTATIVQGDVFDESTLLAGHFDMVYSLGLLEHFTDSRPLLDRCLKLVKPGGIVLTSVPNLAGVWGPLQRRLNPTIYEAHRLFTPAELDAEHVSAGFDVAEPARYFGGFCPLLVNYNAILDRLPHVAAKAALGTVWLAQQAVCWSTAPFPERISNPRALAGHILGVYRRPA